MQALIDGLDQSKTLGQQVHGADAPARDGMCLVGNVVLNVAGAELGLECDRVAGFVEPTQDAALEFVEPAADNDLHLKSFRVRGVCRCCYLIKHRESPKDFKFFKNFQREAAKTSLLQGLVDADPTLKRIQLALALSHNNIGAVLVHTGKSAEAMAAYQRAREIRQKLADAE